MNTTTVQFGAEIAPCVRDSSTIGSSFAGVPQTLGDLIAIWQDTHPRAERMLRTICAWLAVYLEAPVGEIRLDSLEQARRGFRPFLVTRKFKEYSIRTYVNHLQILLKSAKDAGWRQTETISEDWRRVLALVSGPRCIALVRDLAAIRKTPQEVIIEDVDQWVRNTVQKGLSYNYAVKMRTRFWRVVRDCGYSNKLPLCFLREKQYGIAVKDFPIKLRDEVTELLRWKQVPYTWDRPPGGRYRPATAKLLRHTICQLYGFAINIRHETDVDSLRITRLKTEASRTEMSIPAEVKDALLDWKEKTPYSAPGDWVFASPATRGKRPFWPDSMLANYIQPIAAAAGLGHIGWHTFRHSFCGWGKSALKLDETKELARHQNIATTSDLYGGMSLDAKRKAQSRLVKYVRREAKKRP